MTTDKSDASSQPTRFSVGSRIKNRHAIYYPPATVTEITERGFKYTFDYPQVLSPRLGSIVGGESYDDSQWEPEVPSQGGEQEPSPASPAYDQPLGWGGGRGPIREQELLPCPFCGGEPSLEQEAVIEHGKIMLIDNCWQVHCPSCNCQRLAEGGFPNYSSVSEAVTTWNTRHQLNQPVQDSGKDADLGHSSVVITKYKVLDAAPKGYYMTSRAHPETVVRWFLELVHHWFDESLGPNLFTGMRDDAAKYLTHWIETGECAPDHTALEIHTRIKFEEWIESSWRPQDTAQATAMASEIAEKLTNAGLLGTSVDSESQDLAAVRFLVESALTGSDMYRAGQRAGIEAAAKVADEYDRYDARMPELDGG
jgi:hypothetical protein